MVLYLTYSLFFKFSLDYIEKGKHSIPWPSRPARCRMRRLRLCDLPTNCEYTIFTVEPELRCWQKSRWIDSELFNETLPNWPRTSKCMYICLIRERIHLIKSNTAFSHECCVIFRINKKGWIDLKLLRTEEDPAAFWPCLKRGTGSVSSCFSFLWNISRSLQIIRNNCGCTSLTLFDLQKLGTMASTRRCKQHSSSSKRWLCSRDRASKNTGAHHFLKALLAISNVFFKCAILYYVLRMPKLCRLC